MSEKWMAEKALGELLAVIHRDGGHYQLKYGITKATEDAIELVHKLREREQIAGDELPVGAIAETCPGSYGGQACLFYTESDLKIGTKLYTHPAQAVSVLDAPARVGNTTFGKGVKWSTVIGCAQRAYGSKPLTPDQTKAFAEVIDEVRSSAAPAGDGGSHE